MPTEASTGASSNDAIILDELERLHTETEDAQSTFLAARQERDVAISEAIATGVTMYAIAKRLDLSEQAIAKIRDKT